MDLFSYLLGKQSGGGGGGTDLNEYFMETITGVGSTGSGVARMIKKIPDDTAIYDGTTSANYMFSNCMNLTTIPPHLDTSKITTMRSMFSGCISLTTIPLLNTSKVTTMQNMFTDCRNLSNTSLDNVLQMCIGATSYTGTKTLAYLGINAAYHPASKIQALPHYQDFINAGWTIGY